MRLALVTGIDKYAQPGINLNGCVRDATNIKALLESKYRFDCIDFYTDEQVSVSGLLNKLSANVAAIKSGDEFFWYHSGHGTQVPDAEGDESDGMDEALVLQNSDWDHMFTDDQLNYIFKDFPKDAYCTFVFDTCFSGGMYRGGKIRNLIPPDHIKAKIALSRSVTKIARSLTGNSVMISACQEDEYSEEVMFNGEAQGAFTHALIEEINRHGIDCSCHLLFDDVTTVLARSGIKQRPSISGSSSMIERCFLGAVVKDAPKLGRWQKFSKWFMSLFS